MDTRRSYNSPLREEQAQATREAILQALHDLMTRQDGPEDITTEAIAQAAGIQRRTVHRYFPTREDLLAAFWPWLNARIGASTAPETLADIVAGPLDTFPRFDAHEAAMRAAIHSRTGREMRLGTVATRRARFARALAPATAQLPAAQAEMVEALAHLLYSASAWEVMKDYGGLTGAQAGRAATWALEVILSAVASGGAPADVASPDKETRDER
jgi:AcrR family transcriptional regulator